MLEMLTYLIFLCDEIYKKNLRAVTGMLNLKLFGGYNSENKNDRITRVAYTNIRVPYCIDEKL